MCSLYFPLLSREFVFLSCVMHSKQFFYVYNLKTLFSHLKGWAQLWKLEVLCPALLSCTSPSARPAHPLIAGDKWQSKELRVQWGGAGWGCAGAQSQATALLEPGQGAQNKGQRPFLPLAFAQGSKAALSSLPPQGREILPFGVSSLRGYPLWHLLSLRSLG